MNRTTGVVRRLANKITRCRVCAHQRGKCGRCERRYRKPWVSTALRRSVPPTVGSVVLSAR